MAAGLAERLDDRLDSMMMVHPPREVPESWESRFEKLYLEHYGRVVGVLFRLTSSRSEAEELSNEVFWKLYRQRLLPNPDGNVGGWLYRTATNLGIDALRKSARRREHESEAARIAFQSRGSSGPLDEVLRDENRQRVRQVLARLKPVQAKALVLCASGFSYHEVAETLGVKRVSVGTLILRAEQAFRKHFRAVAGEKEEI
ncbi:MAG TPA: sigma-70 family RNA polymerase sigma factor [Terriglobia bacterium]|nr:sigma-70 family RNA polymerase sigma factor [Terriglobia bacterium]